MPGQKGRACGLRRSLDVMCVPVLAHYGISSFKKATTVKFAFLEVYCGVCAMEQ